MKRFSVDNWRQALRSAPEHLKKVVQNPGEIVELLEEFSPLVSKSYLNNASALIEPHLAAMGVRLLEVSDEGVKVELPFRWKNRSVQSKNMFLGSLLSAAEFAVNMFWDRFFSLAVSEITYSAAAVNLVQPIRESVILAFGLPVQERDQFLFQLQSHGSAKFPLEVNLYNTHQHLLGTITLEMAVRSQLSIGSPADSQ